MGRYLIFLCLCLFSGCASLQTSGYISRVDHVYDRQVQADFEKVVSSMMFVLKNKGWTIINEADPSVYERDERYDNNGYRNLLMITNVRKNLLHWHPSRLNVFIHAIGNTCDIQIRSVRSDTRVKALLSAFEKEVHGQVSS